MGLYLEGLLSEGYLCLRFGGLIFRSAYVLGGLLLEFYSVGRRLVTFTCIVSLMLSLSPKISLRFLVPRTFLRVVCARRRVERLAFSTFVIDIVALYILKYTTASTATVTLSLVKTCRQIGQWTPHVSDLEIKGPANQGVHGEKP